MNELINAPSRVSVPLMRRRAPFTPNVLGDTPTRVRPDGGTTTPGALGTPIPRPNPAITLDVRPELIRAMIERESSNRPGAKGKKGERGLMQIMPSTAMDYGVLPAQLFDPEINKRLGTRYLGDLLKKYRGNEFKALLAYNAGPGNVDKGFIPPQALHYAQDVLNKAEQYGRQGLEAGGGAVAAVMGEGVAAAEEPPASDRFSGWKDVGASPAEAGSPPPAPSVAAPTGAPAAGKFAGWRNLGANETPKFDNWLQQNPDSALLGPKGMYQQFTKETQPTTAERSRQEKMSDQARSVLSQVDTMKRFYDSKIAPKVKSGQISSTKEGLTFLYRGRARDVGKDLDPDVAAFITMGGQLAPLANAYYSGQSGGRGGVQAFETITVPHVPHAPTSTWEVVKGQWDLPQFREQLDQIDETVRRLEQQNAGAPPMAPTSQQAPTPKPTPSVRKVRVHRLPSGKWYSSATPNMIYEDREVTKMGRGEGVATAP